MVFLENLLSILLIIMKTVNRSKRVYGQRLLRYENRSSSSDLLGEQLIIICAILMLLKPSDFRDNRHPRKDDIGNLYNIEDQLNVYSSPPLDS